MYESVQSVHHVRLFVTPWTAARQASLSFISQSLPKLISTESVMPSNHLVLSSPSAFNLSQHQGLVCMYMYVCIHMTDSHCYIARNEHKM